MYSFVYDFYKRALTSDMLEIIFQEEHYNNKDILYYILAFAAVLKKEGVQSRKRVVIINAHNPDFLFLIFACFFIGSIPVSLDRNLEPDMLTEMANEEDYILTDLLLPYKKPYMMIDKLYEQIKFVSEDEVEVIIQNIPKILHKNDTIMILHSSGTTGLPKKVLYSATNIAWAIKEYKRIYNFDMNNTIAFALPVHFCLGNIPCGIIPMIEMKRIVMANPEDLSSLLHIIQDQHVEIFTGLPVMYKYMTKMALDKYDLSSLRICDSGGEILPLAIIDKFQQNVNICITEGYGQTETISLTHFLEKDTSGKLRLGSVGQPCRDVACRIVDDQNEEVELRVLGELLVKGPMLMKGYDREDLNKEAFTSDGWFKTGDIFYKDEDDFYYLALRKSDLNQTSINNATLVHAIEDAIYSFDEIVEATVLLNKENSVTVFVKPIDDNPQTVDRLKKNITSLFEKDFKQELFIKFVNYIPRTPSGKVKKRLINQ